MFRKACILFYLLLFLSFFLVAYLCLYSLLFLLVHPFLYVCFNSFMDVFWLCCILFYVYWFSYLYFAYSTFYVFIFFNICFWNCLYCYATCTTTILRKIGDKSLHNHYNTCGRLSIYCGAILHAIVHNLYAGATQNSGRPYRFVFTKTITSYLFF